MLPSDIRLKANPAERWLRSQASSPLREPSLYLALLGVGLIYAAMLSLLFFEYRLDLPVEAAPEAIPVEIILEPPPPKPPDKPAPAPEPAPAAQPAAEEPATDAPRAANNDTKETEAPDPAKAAAPPPPAPPNPTPDPAKADTPAREGTPEAKEGAAEPAADRPPAAPDPTAEADRPKPDPAPPLVEPPADKPKTAPAFSLPTFASVPDFDFGAWAKQTSVAGGKANSTYLTVLYGMIVPLVRARISAHGKPSGRAVTIVFGIDGTGNLMQRRIIRESGSRDLDAAALEAIVQAAPFPPPPGGLTGEIKFTYTDR
jgi:protein TonB